MINWPHFFGTMARQHIMAGAHGGISCSPLTGKVRERKGPGFQYPSQGYTSSDLSSSHCAPPTDASTTSQEYHSLGTRPSTHGPFAGGVGGDTYKPQH
jgi:hypothetical protein